ncbi:MAG TPA: hypothetical protein VE172_03375 [Stackebrandtia sp.]|uniref:hypothetical protein n=1 Tax=Stackebrandtia sp. TaxID=2023065 RepID=UPI002D33640D|nr:hypothetical protein [Stackebrandtia sp.]HZE37829.1 hypothetical protein [Stackebrandtia sp.]
MTKSDEAVFVESAITPGMEVRQDIAERLGDRRAYTLMGAALIIAVKRKFPEGTGSAEIQAYVTEMKARFPEGADNFKPMVIEAIVRGLRGETHLLPDVDPNYLADMSFMLTYAIMSHENLKGDDLEAFVNKVIAMANGRLVFAEG